jgi:hypothetical protein
MCVLSSSRFSLLSSTFTEILLSKYLPSGTNLVELHDARNSIPTIKMNGLTGKYLFRKNKGMILYFYKNKQSICLAILSDLFIFTISERR